MQPKLMVPYFRQNRDYTCGPACLRMVLKYWGREQDEVSLTMLCRTTVGGTGLSEIVEAAEQLGFQGRWKIGAKIFEVASALENDLPVITVVDARVLHGIELSQPLGHMVVILGMGDNMLIYHDPEIGPNQIISQDAFTASWENLRNRMVVVWQEKEMSKKRLRR